MTQMDVKDASGSTHHFATQILASLETAGLFLRALPEGGATPYRNLDLGNTGALVKAGPGTLYAVTLSNNDETGSPPVGSADIFVKFYDKVSTPSASDTPVLTIKVPAGETLAQTFPVGIAFLIGIGVRATLLVGDSDTSNPPTNGMVCNLMYA